MGVISSDMYVIDDRQYHDNRYETPETKVTQRKQKSKSGKKEKDGHKSYKPERIGIKQ